MSLPTASVVLLAAIAGVLATRGARAAAARLGVVSPPDPFVPAHTVAVASLGGVAVAAATYGALVLDAGRARLSAATVVGGLLFLAAGVIDDVHKLAVSPKLALQVLCASGAAALGATLPLTGAPAVDAAGGVVVIVVIVNAVNLTDVCDGLVPGLAVITLLAIGIVDTGLLVPCLAAVGACLGFLVYNAPPASIFLGDSGSSFVGFLLAAFLLAVLRDENGLSTLLQAGMFVGVPLFELAFVVFARARRGEPWSRGSADHLSLRLQAEGLSRWQTDIVVWTGAAILVLAGLWSTHLGVDGRILLAVVLVASLAAASRLLLQRDEPATRRGGP